MIQAAQSLGFGGGPIIRAFLGHLPHCFEDLCQSGDELFQPRCEVGLASAEVVVVVRMSGQSPVVPLQVAGIVLLQGEEATQAVASFVEDERGEQASSAAIAIVIGVDDHELVVDKSSNKRNGKLRLLGLICPCHQRGHEASNVFCFWWQVDRWLLITVEPGTSSLFKVLKGCHCRNCIRTAP